MFLKKTFNTMFLKKTFNIKNINIFNIKNINNNIKNMYYI